MVKSLIFLVKGSRGIIAITLISLDVIMFYNTELKPRYINHHHNFSFLIEKVCNYDSPQFMSKAKSTNDSHEDQAVMVVVNTCHE